MNIKEMIEAKLRELGADGLCNPGAECGCSVDDQTVQRIKMENREKLLMERKELEDWPPNPVQLTKIEQLAGKTITRVYELYGDLVIRFSGTLPDNSADEYVVLVGTDYGEVYIGTYSLDDGEKYEIGIITLSDWENRQSNPRS